jgi:uncharacterized protein
MPVTAMQTAEHLRARAEAVRQRGAERAVRLCSHLGEAQVLLRRYGALRVWLFGSLAAGQPTPDSDVDLAVEGLPREAYFPALAELMPLFGGPVDLVRVEDAAESLRERIRCEGREL